MKKTQAPKIEEPLYEEVDPDFLKQIQEEKKLTDQLFKDGKYVEAADSYYMMYESLPKCELKDVRLDLENPTYEMNNEEKFLFRAIEINPKYRKARLRLIKLYDAQEQYICSQLEWQNVAELGIMTDNEKKLKEQCDAKCIELTKTTLKGWGNKFLNMFGMSTDDFQVNKNPDGTMNISMAPKGGQGKQE